MKLPALLVALAAAFTVSHAQTTTQPPSTTRPPYDFNGLNVSYSPSAGTGCTDAEIQTVLKLSMAATECARNVTKPEVIADPTKFCTDASKCISETKASFQALPNCTLVGVDSSSQLEIAIKALEQTCANVGTTPSVAPGSGAVAGSSAVGISGASAVAVATAAMVLAFAQA